MKTVEEIKAMRVELAEAHASKVRDEGDWHSVEAGQSFILGFDAAIELMEEREKIVAKKLEASCYCDDSGYRSLEPCEACEGLKLLNLTKGENK